MADYTPAFVREAVERAIRYAIARSARFISADDLVDAAKGLRPQLDVMNAGADQKVVPSLEAAFSDLLTRAGIGDAMDNAVHDVVHGARLVNNNGDVTHTIHP